MTHGCCDFAKARTDFPRGIDRIARRVVGVVVVVVVVVTVEVSSSSSFVPAVRRDATTAAWVDERALLVAILVAIVAMKWAVDCRDAAIVPTVPAVARAHWEAVVATAVVAEVFRGLVMAHCRPKD